MGERVVSVRISLLMRTVEDNVLPESQTYAYNGGSTTPADRRLRKVFTHVVAMRNR
jgi:type IV pilus assembly protein PilW